MPPEILLSPFHSANDRLHHGGLPRYDMTQALRAERSQKKTVELKILSQNGIEQCHLDQPPEINRSNEC